MSTAENRNPVLLRYFRRYLDDQEPAQFIADVSQRYYTSTLRRLAVVGSVAERRAALMALSFLGGYECNQVFGQALSDGDRACRLLAEDAMDDIWSRAGNAEQQHRLARLKRWNDAGFFDKASAGAWELCNAAPRYAEAWNQLGIAQYFLGQFEDAVRSCSRVVSLNPYHFPAFVGLGHALLELHEPLLALENFRQALTINPNLEQVRVQVAQMQRSLKD